MSGHRPPVLSICLLVLPVCWLLSGGALVAQVTTGSILGYVTDASGAAIPSALVRATNVETGFVRSVLTQEDGSYRALLLPPGRYEVSAGKAGFENFVQQGIVLAVNQNARLDIALKVGAVTERVNVVADVTGVDTHSSQLTTDVQSEQLRELPVAGNRFLVLANTAPGIIPVNQGYGVNTNPLYNFLGSDAQAAGARYNATDYQFDSSHYRMNSFGGSPIMPSSEAIQEVKVVRNNFSAEYGLSSALVINAATKSGTNRIHGSAYDVLGNDKLNSRAFTSGPVKSKLRYNLFGATVGGPVFIPKLYNGKDRSFFFFSYEGIRQPGAGLVQGGRPLTDAMKRGDFSGLPGALLDPLTNQPFAGNMIPAERLNPFAKMVAERIPAANFGDQYRENFPITRSENQFSVRGDQNITANSRLFGRIFWDRPVADNLSGNLIVPGMYGQFAREIRNRDITFNHIHSFRSNLLNQFTFGTNRVLAGESVTDEYLTDVQKLGVNGWNLGGDRQILPNLQVGGGSQSLMALQNASLLAEQDKSYQVNNLTTWIRNRHTFKFGFEFGRWYKFDGVGYNGNGSDQGSFGFSGQVTGNPYADFMLGVGSIGRSASLTTNLISNNYAGFFQDDVKLSRRLTLNVGIRYRVNQPWAPENGLGAVFLPNQQSTVIPNAPVGLNYIGDTGVSSTLVRTDRNDFSPRIGLAWDPTGNGRTSVRAGYGVYYDNFSAFPFRYSAAVSQPFGVNYFRNIGNIADPFAGGGNPFPYRFDPSAARFTYPVNLRVVLDPASRSAYVQSWGLTVERQVGGMLVEGSYIGRKGSKLGNMYVANPAVFVPGNDAEGRPLSTLANVQQRRVYHPDQFGYILPFANLGNSTYHAMQWSTRGRPHRSLLVTGAWTYGHSIDDNSSPRGVDLSNTGNPFNRHLDKGNSDHDFRHIVTSSLVWDAPLFRSLHAVPRAALGGWTASWMMAAQSGGFGTIFAGQDRSLTGGFSDRADQVLPDYTGVRGDRGREYLNWVNRSAFALPALGAFGNLGRNSIRGPARWVADLSVHKAFPVRESIRVQFRMDGYNIFNHTRLGNCRADWGCAMNNAVTQGSALGSFWGVQSGRTIQVSLAVRY